ncbi:hypothetical protein A9Q91_00115 [Candidatus Gracilibacteria bacterium 28_42_T64]|nr:hypothetical protein A9Q91_00115 [Candidatus Gracilibacteria bacterium 28_42_T64]
MSLFLIELKTFLKQNWWVFILLIFALVIIYLTGKGNITEIIILFLANFIGNLFIMVMQANYTAQNNKIGAIYQVTSLSIFLLISLYSFIYLGQYQYILWQIAYTGAAIKAFGFYYLGKNLLWFNEKSFLALNGILFIIFMSHFEFQNFAILQVIGFSLITSGLVSIQDKIRYWLNLIGIGLLTSGSAWGVLTSYNLGNIDGVALGFFILTLTVFVYYSKLLKKYI